MASPQKENGFTPIANELLDAIVKSFSFCRESRAVIWIMRQTYSWHKAFTEEPLKATQFERDSGLPYSSAKKALQSLKDSKIAHPNGINKDYEKWTGKGSYMARLIYGPAHIGAKKGSYMSLLGLKDELKNGPYKVLKKFKEKKEMLHGGKTATITAIKITKINAFAKSFDIFWPAYPRKNDKAGALREWLKMKPDPELFRTIMEAVENQKRSGQPLAFDVKQPYARTWLHNQRWEDELPETNGIKPPSDFSKRFDEAFYQSLIERDPITKQWVYKKTGELFK